MNAAVYAGTRNTYSDMVTAAKSLASNSSCNEIIFLIEDREFPEKLPPYVRCIDVSKQKYFKKDGPNVYKLWTWMVLMRAALPKLLPQYDRILSLDNDTIIDRNIDELWRLDLSSYYMAGVAEPGKTKNKNEPYVNCGVIVFNLGKIRADCMDNSLIYALNNKKYKFAEQDCMNELFRGKILDLPSMYNANDWTPRCSSPRIYHFAGEKEWRNEPIVEKYRNLSWDAIRR